MGSMSMSTKVSPLRTEMNSPLADEVSMQMLARVRLMLDVVLEAPATPPCHRDAHVTMPAGMGRMVGAARCGRAQRQAAAAYGEMTRQMTCCGAQGAQRVI